MDGTYQPMDGTNQPMDDTNQPMDGTNHRNIILSLIFADNYFTEKLIKCLTLNLEN